MNRTKRGSKDREFHKEGYLQRVSAEQKEYGEASAHSKMNANNNAITDFQTDELLEKIFHQNNLNKAYQRVKSNKGAGGVDGMSVDELLTFLKENREQLIQQLIGAKAKPKPVRRVEIPK